MTAIATVLIGAGAVFLVIGAWGVLTLADALSRQHAATKAGTMALAFALIGASLLMPSFAWAWRLALILSFLMATLPIASHLLARAAAAEPGLREEVRNAPLVGDDPCWRMTVAAGGAVRAARGERMADHAACHPQHVRAGS